MLAFLLHPLSTPLVNYTCRNRHFLLPPDEYALATAGHISPALRQRSSSYYWSHTASDPAQQTARHDAICTKQGGWHLRTFGSHGRWATAAAEKCGPPNAGVAMSVKAGVLDTCKAFTLDDLPEDWRKAHGLNNHTRGAGWWRWKPYYLLNELRSVPHGDVIVHADYDIVISKTPAALWCLGQNSPQGVATFHFPCLTDRAWTKRETTLALGATDAMLDSATLYAGIVVLRRTAETEAFLQEWLDWTLKGELATDHLDPAVQQEPVFVEHRHDQAILSLVAKRRGIKSYPFPTAQHDVRDVWAWEAGYCQAGFEWPLPDFRPLVFTKSWPRGVYITHYKEMGRMKESMEQCLAQEPRTRHLPLPDYVGSARVLTELRAQARLRAAIESGAVLGGGFPRRQARRKGNQLAEAHEEASWSPAVLAAAARQPAVEMQHKEQHRAEIRAGLAGCGANQSYGGLFYEGRPYLWVASGCRGIFLCAGTAMRCGNHFAPKELERMLAQSKTGKGRLNVCSCDLTEGLEEGRYYFDGVLRMSYTSATFSVVYREREHRIRAPSM